VLKAFPELVFSVSATTRKKRDNETDGKDYFFLTEEEFKKRIKNNDFLEWEEVYDGCFYGTLKSYIEESIAEGKKILMDLDVKGALSIKRIYPEAILIYIVPPDREELIKRLTKRNTEDQESLKKRIHRAEMELDQKDKFDHTIMNVELDKAIADTKDLIRKLTKE
jgi:guanylate kinase